MGVASWASIRILLQYYYISQYVNVHVHVHVCLQWMELGPREVNKVKGRGYKWGVQRGRWGSEWVSGCW